MRLDPTSASSGSIFLSVAFHSFLYMEFLLPPCAGIKERSVLLSRESEYLRWWGSPRILILGTSNGPGWDGDETTLAPALRIARELIGAHIACYLMRLALRLMLDLLSQCLGAVAKKLQPKALSKVSPHNVWVGPITHF